MILFYRYYVDAIGHLLILGEGKCLDWKEDAKIIFKLSEIRRNVGGIGKKSFINSSNTDFPFSSVHFSKLFFFFSKKIFQKDVNTTISSRIEHREGKF